MIRLPRSRGAVFPDSARNAQSGGGRTRPALHALVLLALLAAAPQAQTPPMTTLAERYVRLVLAVGQHDADYVDAFYGPAEWRKEAEAAKLPLAEVESRAAALAKELAAVPVPGVEIERL